VLGWTTVEPDKNDGKIVMSGLTSACPRQINEAQTGKTYDASTEQAAAREPPVCPHTMTAELKHRPAPLKARSTGYDFTRRIISVHWPYNNPGSHGGKRITLAADFSAMYCVRPSVRSFPARERLQTLTIHHGRHTFISHALAAEARDAAGHQNVSITSAYLHVAVEDDGVGELFRF
jgi:integrase